MGDQYIEGTAGEYMGRDVDPAIEGLLADLMGGHDDKIIYCEDCTVSGGDFRFSTYYGDDDDG